MLTHRVMWTGGTLGANTDQWETNVMNKVLFGRAPRLLGVVAVGLSLATSAMAADKGKSDPPKEEKVGKSAITGTAFPNKPFRLADNSTYFDYMNAIAAEQGRKCKKVESFGWDLAHGDQKGLQAIVDATMDSVQNGGFKATAIQPKTTEGSPAVTIAFEKAKQKGLVLWAPLGDGVLLLICDAVAK